ncbi:TIGR02757 family protein [Bdellovibrionota bacterium FG-1]
MPRLSLPELLNSVQEQFHREAYLPSDPLEFVHHYSDPWDQEAVAVLAALLAYGNVKQIKRSVQDALNRMGTDSPSAFVKRLGTAAGVRHAKSEFVGFVHRFNRGEDLVLLFRLLEQSWRTHGSLGAQFVLGLEPGASDITVALDSLMDHWRKWAVKLDTQVAASSFGYLLTAPRDGSCCKRWCMLLRWMGRKDGIDPGLWTEGGPLAHTFTGGRFVRSSQLVIPLDTHTGRISQQLRLTERKSLGWLAALEVTAALKIYDPLDPVRYDFALARVGILKQGAVLSQRR